MNLYKYRIDFCKIMQAKKKKNTKIKIKLIAQIVKTKLQKRASIETVLNRVKDRTDTASRRWRLAEGDYQNLLDIEKKWVKETKRNEAAREMNLMVNNYFKMSASICWPLKTNIFNEIRPGNWNGTKR